MALVAYSDNETSDVEDAPAPKISGIHKSTGPSTSGFRTTESRRIKVVLPVLKPEAADVEVERPAKRARVGGGGFNSFLPAPKRTAEQSKGELGRGVSLKTSSEAAFSRERPDFGGDAEQDGEGEEGNTGLPSEPAKTVDVVEPKSVGKATKFKPLSVQADKKKRMAKRPENVLPPYGNAIESSAGNVQTQSSTATPTDREDGSMANHHRPNRRNRCSRYLRLKSRSILQKAPFLHPAKPSQPKITKRSTFLSVQYRRFRTATTLKKTQDITAGLNLTPAQRRQIFGRNGKTNDINIAHFNMDAEYASNEVLCHSGETVEHRAVKSIASGKHSLQQLVNNAKSQQENLEDKWAEEMRERGEGSSRYGWGK